MSGSKDGITKELSYKDGKYSMTFTDGNSVLSEYNFISSDSNVKVAKSGNKLTITSEKAVKGSIRITALRNNTPTVSSSAKMIAYGDPNLQDLITGVENVRKSDFTISGTHFLPLPWSMGWTSRPCPLLSVTSPAVPR